MDVEPTVFWDGVHPSSGDLLEQWEREVGFVDNVHGQVSAGNNGPSGAGVLRSVLDPLGLEPSEVVFTHAVPWYFIKRGREASKKQYASASRRSHGNLEWIRVRCLHACLYASPTRRLSRIRRPT